MRQNRGTCVSQKFKPEDEFEVVHHYDKKIGLALKRTYLNQNRFGHTSPTPFSSTRHLHSPNSLLQHEAKSLYFGMRKNGSQLEPGQSFSPGMALSSLPPPDGTTCCTTERWHLGCPRHPPNNSRHSQMLVSPQASRATPCQ
ncbi:UNVERIFIED_CONTAM: hypothetical protein Slati_4458100 [Sesamum latifolium]|uniref:Uncharacterized protein n=1 Tax=Sesamum latifolium TaxID=2727402 RepID=A0AAW2SR61_9LAMI